MKFEEINLTVNAIAIAFQPFDRGASGAFVYRQGGINLHSPRLVISTTTNDDASDKYVVQVNTPRVCPPTEGSCDVAKPLGTDLVKTELRFLATTSSQHRLDAVDTQIALLQELRTAISLREKLYA